MPNLVAICRLVKAFDSWVLTWARCEKMNRTSLLASFMMTRGTEREAKSHEWRQGRKFLVTKQRGIKRGSVIKRSVNSGANFYG
eukprot:3447116-Rhodomonas_salina.1